VSDDVRANTDLRVALRLLDAAESIDVIGTPAAAHLPRRSPGRGLVRIDGHVTMFQTAMCTDTTSLVAAVVDATATGARPLPRAPWCPPLPSLLRRADLPAGAIGLLDLPDLQQVQPLQWAPGDGGVLVSAAARRGATTALQLLAATALEFGHRVYVLDGGGDARWSTWVSHPRFGGAVPIADHERLWRLLHHCSGAPAVLVVDRLDTVRSVLDDPSTFTAASALDRLLADPAVTLVASVVDEHSLPARLGARVTHHWRLTGVGRMSMEDGTHAQLAIDPQVPPVDPADRTPVAPPVEPIPRRLRIDRLPTHRDGRPALGLGVPSGEPIHLSLRPGEHLLVLGAPRTGRTSALATVSVVWRAVLPGHPLVVVDDADTVDDSDGSLARLAGDGRTTIIAAARPDALRTQYGHWTTILRRSRSGLVAAGGSELDGDLLGQILPRTLPAPPRPGLMWLVADGTASLLQVAQG